MSIPSVLSEALRELPAYLRPAPLFVFNEEHEGVMGEPRVTMMLEKIKANGFGGAYIHPRPGMITEYLSPRWFELVRHTVRECRRLGLVPHLYDENSYPSGFAGGHVVAQAPDCRSRYFLPVYGRGPATLPTDALSVYRWTGELPGDRIPATEVAVETDWIAFVLRDLESKPFLADGSYVSLVDPLSTATFLTLTHARYRAELGDDDWRALGSIFTDEPHLPGSNLCAWSPGLHGSHWVLSSFHRECGYDLRDRIADLYYETPTASATRYDFYNLLHRMWMNSWARPLQKWCQEHGIRLTGHYHDHDWPAPYATPGQVHLLSALDWPGTDFLECFELLGHDFYDAQGFEAAPAGQEPFGLLYLKQVESVARQYGKERVMDECWGAGGHDATPADWLRLGRYLAVHGVNHFVPHHCLLTISGARKQDHPQFFSDQIPVFNHLRPMNDELTRLSAFSVHGRLANRLLVLDPLTTGFILARKADALRGGPAMAESSGNALRDSLSSLLPLRASVSRLVQSMSDRFLDFDLGDEYVLEEIGSATAGGQLRVGEADYQLLVWPEGMQHLRPETSELLTRYLHNGGCIYGVRPDALLVGGRPSTQLEEWERAFAAQIEWHEDTMALCEAVAQKVPPRLGFAKIISQPGTGMALSYRLFANNQPGWLLVNSHPQHVFEAIPEVPAAGRVFSVYNPASDENAVLNSGSVLCIPATEARILFLGEPKTDGVEAKVETPTAVLGLEDLQWLAGDVVDSNVLVVDRCCLTVNGEQGPIESVQSANRRYWTAHGIPSNGWLMRGQMNGNLLKRDKFFGAGTGGSIQYDFEIAGTPPMDAIRLVVERPELWTITVNEQLLSFTGATAWRDPRMLSVAVGGVLRQGRNTVRLSAERFQVRQEIEAIYLLGPFRVDPAKSGFAIASAQSPVLLGSWLKLGMPFYDGAVDYHFRLPGNFGGGRLVIPSKNWGGSVVELQHGRHKQLAYGPDLNWKLDPAHGRELSLRVTGSAKNLFGPWHLAFKPRKRAWSTFWLSDGVTLDGPRPGCDYDLLDLGLGL